VVTSSSGSFPTIPSSVGYFFCPEGPYPSAAFFYRDTTSVSSFSNLLQTNVPTDLFHVATIESCPRFGDLRRLPKQLSGPNNNYGSKPLAPWLRLYSLPFSLVAHYVSGRVSKRLGSCRAFSNDLFCCSQDFSYLL
jgi:hypothetical protein